MEILMLGWVPGSKGIIRDSHAATGLLHEFAG